MRLICVALETQPPKNQDRFLDQGRTPTQYDDAPATLRILIAEDSPDNCALVKAYLKDTPHVIDFVEDGRRAVEQFQSRNYDLILMDMQMPEMDGMTATRNIREIEAQQNRKPIPIVAITANALNRDVETSREAGCNAHLSKPISKEKLIGAIQQYGPRTPKSDDAVIWIEAPEGLEKLVPDYPCHPQAGSSAAIRVDEVLRLRANSPRGARFEGYRRIFRLSEPDSDGSTNGEVSHGRGCTQLRTSTARAVTLSRQGSDSNTIVTSPMRSFKPSKHLLRRHGASLQPLALR